MITNIKIDKIFPHPDNPRKDLGDLSELAESIKAQGILQNLTVVPKRAGYCPSCNLYNNVIGKCKENHDLKEKQPCPKWESNGEFTAVIGHRRLAAAKLAGRTEVPCVISDMDHKTQVATMLLENLQRSDLTVYEQAQGFQMMLDFGETIGDIAKQTGFSYSTISRRVKLLDLDKNKFQQSVVRGATLQDYAELDKISDIKLKNKVLEKIGTSDFKWSLQQAIDTEKRDKNRAALIEELEKFATKVNKTDGLHIVEWLSCNTSRKVTKPHDAGEKKYFFCVNGPHYIYLLDEAAQSTPQTAGLSQEQRQLQERRQQLEELSKRALQLRDDFVRNYTGAKKHTREIMAFAVNATLEGEWKYDISDEVRAMLSIEPPAKDDENGNDFITFAEVSGAFEASPEKVLLVAIYCGIADQHSSYYTYTCQFKENPDLDMLYDFLEAIGYEMSDEERALRDGTHELYVRENENE